MFYCVKSVIKLSIWKLNTMCEWISVVWTTEVTEFKLGLLWWVGPCHQVSPHTIPPNRMVERTGTKARKLGSGWRYFNMRGKAVCTSKINLFPSSRQVLTTGLAFLSLFPELLLLSTIPYGTAFLSAGSICPACVLSQVLDHSQPRPRRFGWKQRGKRQWKRKPLVLCEHFSALAKILVCYQHCSMHKTKAQSCMAGMQ